MIGNHRCLDRVSGPRQGGKFLYHDCDWIYASSITTNEISAKSQTYCDWTICLGVGTNKHFIGIFLLIKSHISTTYVYHFYIL